MSFTRIFASNSNFTGIGRQVHLGKYQTGQ
jgi:hypothetical protein